MEEDNCEGYWGKPLKPTKAPKESRDLLLPPFLIIFIVFVVVLLSVFAYLSVQPRVQLAADPPAQFLAARPDWNAKQREAQQKIARAYWDRVVTAVQWRYTYGSTLPLTPPEEFRIVSPSLPSAAADTSESRDFYWQRLREVWPYAWKQVYVWDTQWLSRYIQHLRGRVLGGV
jgi:hypothetical protein